MATINTSVNSYPTIIEEVGTGVSSVDFSAKAVKYDSSDNVVLCSVAGEAALGCSRSGLIQRLLPPADERLKLLGRIPAKAFMGYF